MAESIVAAGGFEDDEDDGTFLLYTGAPIINGHDGRFKPKCIIRLLPCSTCEGLFTETLGRSSMHLLRCIEFSSAQPAYLHVGVHGMCC